MRQALALGRRRPLGERRQPRDRDVADVNAVVRAALPDVHVGLHAAIQVLIHLARKLPPVHADERHVRDVLIGLIDHAAAAMPAGGMLRVVTDIVNVGPPMRRIRTWLRAGRFVRLEVADSGRGLNEATLDQAFDAAPTVDACGADRGLPAVDAVVKQCNGFIWASNEIGQGTRVTVLLPAAPDAWRVTRGVDRKCVLLVEDDDGIRELVDGLLWRCGYAVAAYSSAEEALHHRAPFDLLLTDVGLPGLTGTALAREVQRQAPAVPVLLMSADPDRADDAGTLTAGGFLHKPFTAHDLVHHVQRLLCA